MRFYTGQHQHYCGIDLHARTLYLCVLDAEGAWVNMCVNVSGGFLPLMV